MAKARAEKAFVDELIAALQEHRAGSDLGACAGARRANAQADYIQEHGERGLRTLGGRRATERLLEDQEPTLDTAALVAVLERGAGARG